MTPSAADLLIGACVHGAGWSSRPAFRWVLDGLKLLDRGRIDWPYLLDQAARGRVAPPLIATLGRLRADVMRSKSAFNVCLGEVVSDVEQPAPVLLRHLIGEAVAEIQRRGMNALAPA